MPAGLGSKVALAFSSIIATALARRSLDANFFWTGNSLAVIAAAESAKAESEAMLETVLDDCETVEEDKAFVVAGGGGGGGGVPGEAGKCVNGEAGGLVD